MYGWQAGCMAALSQRTGSSQHELDDILTQSTLTHRQQPTVQVWKLYTLALVFSTGNKNTALKLCILGNFSCFFFCRLLIFFKMNFFEKFFQEYHQCQTAWIQIRPDILSGLIWVQTVCNNNCLMIFFGSLYCKQYGSRSGCLESSDLDA